MKRFALVAAAFLLFAACSKDEPEPQPENRQQTSNALTATSWVGTANDIYQGYPVMLTCSLDFLTDSTGELYLEAVFAANLQNPLTLPFRYTLVGSSGTITSDGFSEPLLFEYDSAARTLTMELLIGDGTTLLGGVTVFHPRGEEPTQFPDNTTWRAEQKVPSGDTLLPVDWELAFWEYGYGGSLTVGTGATRIGSHVFWQYDDESHTGTIKLNGTQYPFSYDVGNETIDLEYNTTLQVDGNPVDVGGTMRFYRQTDD